MRCASCARPSSDPVCQRCVAALPFLRPPFCQRCAQPLPTSLSQPLCRLCREHPRRFDFVALRAVFLYREPIRKLLFSLKYGKRTHVARFFASFLAALLHHPFPPFPQKNAFDVIVPVPISPARLPMRWYNQAEVLADELSAFLEIPVAHFVRRTSWLSVPQTRLPLKERRRNVRHAFSSLPEAKGRTVLLLDDVATSCQTLSEAARVLRQQKARAVFALALCRTPL